ncbi:MAG TPA: hypothetical protein VF494_07725 [Candidatus Limnocylindrales bacterium]
MDTPRTLTAYAGQQVDPLLLVPDDDPDLREAADIDAELVAIAPSSLGTRRG